MLGGNLSGATTSIAVHPSLNVATSSFSPSKDASTALSTTGTASGPASFTSSSSGSSSKLSGGAIAGIAVGICVGIGLFFAAVFFARRAAMWKKAASPADPADRYEPETAYGSSVSDKVPQYEWREMDGDPRVHELPAATEAAHELAGRMRDSELPA
ncbi:hypothetical protein E8E11_001497 [Didymella keratinophila]|nr:hypothetical protein E8E11_001497 [Didymella keratinophila]